MNALDIKENRKRLKLTQEQLGAMLGVSKRTVINYENGEVIPETKSELLHKIFFSEKSKSSNTDDDAFTIELINKLFASELFKEKLSECIKKEIPNRITKEDVLKQIDSLRELIKITSTVSK
jgi:DNA-binding XRE family transcriptional regulator